MPFAGVPVESADGVTGFGSADKTSSTLGLESTPLSSNTVANIMPIAAPPA
jgi:hypothetical protein